MFRILESIELQGWREQPIDMPLVEQRDCPCCGTELRTAAAIVGDDRTVRVGCCPSCGYIGYQDRPTAEWFQSFYSSDWDSGRDIDKIIESVRTKKEFNTHPLNDTVQGIPFNPEAKIFEMGTGYGSGLAGMRNLGYKHLSGVESCQHRARVSREGFGLDVRHESVEQHEGGPYDIILSFHVLEHCYDPSAIIAKLASMQRVGGHVVIAVPNVTGEPTMGVLMFLPHLHSFSTDGLERLLMRHGYEVVEHKWTRDNQTIIARYTGVVKSREPGNFAAAGADKLRRGTSIGALQLPLFVWPMFGDEATLGTHEYWQQRDKADKPRCLLVEPIRERRTDAPTEIQWEGPLRLYVK